MRSALAFLTVLPVGGSVGPARRTTLVAFPLVGVAIGCAWAGLAWGASEAWSPIVGAALVVALDLVLTGGLHADAVADVADGLASREPREEALRIMREPEVGAIGAVAVGTVLLLRFAWLAALASAELWPLIAAAPVCGRVAMVIALSLSPAGRDPSLARGFASAASPAVAAAAVVAGAAACLVAGRLAGSGSAEGLALAGLAAAVAVAVVCERAWRGRFGALTGDATGSTGMAAEITALAVVALTPAVEV
jgi:adenosylcobinamide-GDP ribazoletransferase